MKIAAYNLANRILSAQDWEEGIAGIAHKSGVSTHSLEALLKDSTISAGNLARITEYLGLTQPAYYEYVEFGINWLSMNRRLQEVGFVPGDEQEGIGALRWIDETGEKMVSLYVSSHSGEGKRKQYNYAVSLANTMGSGYVVVASEKTYHEACNIAYLQAAVLGWEAK